MPCLLHLDIIHRIDVVDTESINQVANNNMDSIALEEIGSASQLGITHKQHLNTSAHISGVEL